MDEQKLKYIITELEESNIDERALFGIYDDGRNQDETYIRANKEGLINFAIDLLKAAETHDERIEKDGFERVHSLNPIDDWVDNQSDVFIDYIEPFPIGDKDLINQSRTESFKEKIGSIGCIALLILFVISAFIGIGTLFEWMM